MFSAVCFGTNNLERAGQFYNKLLGTVGLQRLLDNDNELGYGTNRNAPIFWVLLPFDKLSATHGNGTQIIFDDPDAQTVDRLYQMALQQGGTDVGLRVFANL